MKNKKSGKIIRNVVLAVILVPLAAFLLLVAVLSATEFRPGEEEQLSVMSPVQQELSQGQELTVVTWNAGFCTFHDGTDFFMDGGEMVRPCTVDEMKNNMTQIGGIIDEMSPDILLLQEVDSSASRSFGVDQSAYFAERDGYESSFAINFKSLFVPYPWPPIGQVESGLLTMSRYAESAASRIGLPVPFSWPVRLANFKRCLLVSRLPVAGCDKELVIVNLHLEAYDDSGGRQAQTEKLAGLLEAECAKGNYVIAGGDFNQTFSGVDMTAYPVYENRWVAGIIEESEYPASLKFIMDDSVPTCRSLDAVYRDADHDSFQYYMLDGFIVSDNIEVIEAKTLDEGFLYTDHNPVRMIIRLK